MEIWTRTVANLHTVKYINGMLNPYKINEYISIDKTLCRYYRSQLLCR